MNDKIMSRGEVVSNIANVTGLPVSEVDGIVRELENTITSQLGDGGEIRLPGFGTFKTSARSAREGRNPRTGETLNIAAHSVVRFVPGRTLKEVVAKNGSASTE